jgi:hypothetical protein
MARGDLADQRGLPGEVGGTENHLCSFAVLFMPQPGLAGGGDGMLRTIVATPG